MDTAPEPEPGTERDALGPVPNFDALFPVCRCGAESCTECGGYQLTPRSAAALWLAVGILADRAHDDVAQHGDGPVVGPEGWWVFAAYPRITWRCDAAWRHRAALAYDDLTADLAAGRWPRPRCAAEEMAVHLLLREVQMAGPDGWADSADFARQIPHPDDFDWEAADEILLEDDDILALFDLRHDGLEDPDTDANRAIGMGDYRPRAWFTTFPDMPPRDEPRPA